MRMRAIPVCQTHRHRRIISDAVKVLRLPVTCQLPTASGESGVFPCCCENKKKSLFLLLCSWVGPFLSFTPFPLPPPSLLFLPFLFSFTHQLIPIPIPSSPLLFFPSFLPSFFLPSLLPFPSSLHAYTPFIYISSIIFTLILALPFTRSLPFHLLLALTPHNLTPPPPALSINLALLYSSSFLHSSFIHPSTTNHKHQQQLKEKEKKKRSQYGPKDVVRGRDPRPRLQARGLVPAQQ